MYDVPLQRRGGFTVSVTRVRSLYERLSKVDLLFLTGPTGPTKGGVRTSLLRALLSIYRGGRVAIILSRYFVTFAKARKCIS